VLDLFAGSGGMGIEALSRGANSAVFVDENERCVSCIRENLRMAKVESLVQTMDAYRFLDLYAEEASFDLIFADPPYDIPNIQEFPKMFSEWLTDDGIIIIEHRPQLQFHEAHLLKKEYGSTTCTIFAKQ
jgi:16S rRNA (guanine(966)-N(2))-methyltransferase RsmD